jgi:isopentenyl diphosphate isomerase/L-lactate dehydrogenase-like FMN-dependent dehydrogenase
VTDTTPAAVGTFVLDDGIVVDSLLDLQARATARWDAGVRAYVQDGAGSNRAVQANRMAHERWALRSRVLRDVSSIDTTTTVLGQRVELPRVGVRSVAEIDSRIVRRAPAGSSPDKNSSR